MPHHRHHRPLSVPPALLALIFVAATIAVIAPFVIVVSGIEWATSRELRWTLGAIALSLLILPLLFRVMGRRSRKELL